MKRTRPYSIRKLIRLILVAQLVTVLICTPLLASASPSADFHGELGTPIWSFGNVTVYSDSIDSIDDLFGDVTKELGPGMKKEINLRLENHSGVAYTFFMGAQPKTGTEASALERFFPGKRADDSLLDAIDTTIHYTGGDIYTTEGVIYDGKLRGNAGEAMYHNARGVPLGTLGPASFGTVRATITIPVTLGNAYMDTLCAVDWWFAAEAIPGPTPTPTPTTSPTETPPTETPPTETPPPGTPPPGTPSPGAISGSDDPYTPPPSPTISPPPAPPTDIGDPDTPLVETPIDDPKVPQTDVTVVVDQGSRLPQTGGIATNVMPAALALSILLLLLAMTYIKKRKNQKT